MHEMAVDIQDGGFTGYLTHNVRIPDFIEHSFWHYLVSYYFHISRAGASPARTLYGVCVMLRIGYGPGLPPPWPLAMITHPQAPHLYSLMLPSRRSGAASDCLREQEAA